MSIRAQVNKAFAAAMGTKPMTVERQNRFLLEGGFLRKGRAGVSLHYSAHELAHLILAQAAGMPSDVPHVVRTLADLHNKEGQSLVESVTEIIENAATPEGRRALVEVIAADRDSGTWRLGMYAGSGPFAWIGAGQNLSDTIQFSPVNESLNESLLDFEPPVVRHLTMVTPGLFLVAANLLANSPARLSHEIPLPEPSPGRDGEGSATPEKTKASGTGIHEGLHVGQPALGKSADSTQELVQSTLQPASGQSPSSPDRPGSQVRHLPDQPAHGRTRHHGAHSRNRAAAAAC